MNLDRLNEKFEDLKKAYTKLKESTELTIENDIIIDGVIQRFEFTFELSWKLMKAFMEYEGTLEVESPRATIRAAFKDGLIEDGEEWISMMLDRNRTSHVYDEDTAHDIYNNIKNHHILKIKEFIDTMNSKI